MRLLCDQNVDQRYVDAFVAANDFSVVTVRAVLDARASDPDIAAYATANEYVVSISARRLAVGETYTPVNSL
jgi:predicted nuclease of predicted toxin-antitoxin system